MRIVNQIRCENVTAPAVDSECDYVKNHTCDDLAWKRCDICTMKVYTKQFAELLKLKKDKK